MTWKTVANWDSYEVSDGGEVRSVGRVLKDGRVCGGRVLKQYRDDKGYCYVTLSDGKRLKTYAVHVLVMEAFGGPRPPGMEILHENDNHSRNGVADLRYGTKEENRAERWERHRRRRRRQ